MNWADLKVGDVLIAPDVNIPPWNNVIRGSIYLMLENNLPSALGEGLLNMRVLYMHNAREVVWTVGGTITAGYTVLRGVELILEGQ